MQSVSVVVCTRDRPVELARCLMSLADQPFLELLVVDDGSRDAGAVERAAHAGGARLIRVPGLGLAAARNRALEEATGDIALFVDDDAEGRPGLVAAHAAAYHHDDSRAAGGPIVSAFAEPGRPRWLDASLEGYLSAFHLGSEPHEIDLDREEVPYGANLSVQRLAALDVGGFESGLGRQGSALGSGEEAALVGSLVTAGGRVRWCPDAVVDHHIDPRRLRVRWFARRAYAQGRTDVAMRRRTETVSRAHDLREALRLAWTALRPGGTPGPAAGPHRAARRAACEGVRRIRLLGAAIASCRR